MTWTITDAADGRFEIRRAEPGDDALVTTDATEEKACDTISTLYGFLHLGSEEASLIKTEGAAAAAGANAPYKIKKAGAKFVVVNNTGATKATFTDRDKALAYLRALYASVKGASKRAAKVPFTGKAKDRMAK